MPLILNYTTQTNQNKHQLLLTHHQLTHALICLLVLLLVATCPGLRQMGPRDAEFTGAAITPLLMTD